MYSHASAPSGATSNRWPSVSEQMNVLPFGRRLALDPMWLKNPWLLAER